MKPSVYLAGPITGLSFSGATDWREYAWRKLSAYGINAFSPMRSKDYLAGETHLSAHGYDEYILSCARGITTRDRFDCTRCDVVLVNLLGAERVSIGTMIELGWADAARRPVVLVMEPEGNPHDHAMVREIAGFVVGDLDVGLAVCRTTVLP